MSSELDERLAGLEASGDVDEVVDLGCELADVDRHGDAERCFRRAVQMGSVVAAFNLGNALAAQRRWAEAAAAYEQAVSGGETDAWLNLGLVLEELDDVAGAMRAFEQAAAAGDSNGALALAFRLREQGRPQEAVARVQEAAEAGNLVAGGALACWTWDRTRDPALEPALRAGAEHYPSARAALAGLLRETGRTAEARVLLERGVQVGETESWLPLGNLLRDVFGDPAAAEAAYRGGIRAGDLHCHHNLALLLEDRGAIEQAAEQFRLGAAGGDALAARALRDRSEGSSDRQGRRSRRRRP